MEPWLTDFLNQFADAGNYAQRRRPVIPARWPDAAAIKNSIPKGGLP